MESLSSKDIFDALNQWKIDMAKNGFLHLLYVYAPIGNTAYAPSQLMDQIQKRFEAQQKIIEDLTHSNRVLAGDKRKSLGTISLLLDHFEPLSWLPASVLTDLKNARKTIDEKIKNHDAKHQDQIIEP